MLFDECNYCNLQYFEDNDYIHFISSDDVFSFHFHFLSMIRLLNTKDECIFINFSVLLYFLLA